MKTLSLLILFLASPAFGVHRIPEFIASDLQTLFWCPQHSMYLESVHFEHYKKCFRYSKKYYRLHGRTIKKTKTGLVFVK